jgi:hypothetical protein
MHSAALVLSLAFAAAAGCQCGTLTPEEIDRRYPLARQIHLSRNGIDALHARLRERLGADVRARYVLIADRTAVIEAQDPRAPGNLDRYELDGAELSVSPISLELGAEETIEDGLFGFDAELLGTIVKVTRAATATAGVEDGHVASVSLRRSGGRVLITVSVEGPRRRAELSFDAAGELQVEEP